MTLPTPLSPIDLCRHAAGLGQSWRSDVVARPGHSQLKVLRMDGSPSEEEVHPYAEALLVLQGQLKLRVRGEDLVVGAGELCTIEAGVPHAVGEGSWGTLVIVDAAR